VTESLLRIAQLAREGCSPYSRFTSNLWRRALTCSASDCEFPHSGLTCMTYVKVRFKEELEDYVLEYFWSKKIQLAHNLRLFAASGGATFGLHPAESMQKHRELKTPVSRCSSRSSNQWSIWPSKRLTSIPLTSRSKPLCYRDDGIKVITGVYCFHFKGGGRPLRLEDRASDYTWINFCKAALEAIDLELDWCVWYWHRSRISYITRIYHSLLSYQWCHGSFAFRLQRSFFQPPMQPGDWKRVFRSRSKIHWARESGHDKCDVSGVHLIRGYLQSPYFDGHGQWPGLDAIAGASSRFLRHWLKPEFRFYWFLKLPQSIVFAFAIKLMRQSAKEAVEWVLLWDQIRRNGWGHLLNELQLFAVVGEQYAGINPGAFRRNVSALGQININVAAIRSSSFRALISLLIPQAESSKGA